VIGRGSTGDQVLDLPALVRAIASQDRIAWDRLQWQALTTRRDPEDLVADMVIRGMSGAAMAEGDSPPLFERCGSELRITLRAEVPDG
jgi:hypothetical protein